METEIPKEASIKPAIMQQGSAEDNCSSTESHSEDQVSSDFGGYEESEGSCSGESISTNHRTEDESRNSVGLMVETNSDESSLLLKRQKEAENYPFQIGLVVRSKDLAIKITDKFTQAEHVDFTRTSNTGGLMES